MAHIILIMAFPCLCFWSFPDLKFVSNKGIKGSNRTIEHANIRLGQEKSFPRFGMNPKHLKLDARMIDDAEFTFNVASDGDGGQEVEEGNESVNRHPRFHFGHR